jgi:hypothetical protein
METEQLFCESEYNIIDVTQELFENEKRLSSNYTHLETIAWENKKVKPLLVKQIEDYDKPLTFDLMKIGNYYSVRVKPYPDYSPYVSYGNFVAQCIGKEFDKKGNKWITYKMISDPDEYLKCQYIVIKSTKFTNKTFKRLPEDYWTNYKKYEKQINKEYEIDHVELTGIY